MGSKLIQKHLLKGTTEYELFDDHIAVRGKSKLSKDGSETLTVTLAVLNPEPVITKTHLEFLSRVNGEALLTMALSKPNVTEFNDFVAELKQKAKQEYDAISGLSVSVNSSVKNGNSFDEPPEFSEVSTAETIKNKKVDVESVAHSIKMLETYVDNEEVQPLISALTALQHAPDEHAKLVEVANSFNELGASQGAVLTYAPYITIMLSDDPFG